MGRDAQADDHRHEAAPGGAGRRREGDELLRLGVEGFQQAGSVVEGHPDFAGQQRLLHELVADRLRVHVGPQRCLDPVEHGRSLFALEVGHHAAGPRGPQIALEEALEEAGVGQAALGAARAFRQRLAPGAQLLPGQRVDVGALGQVLQRIDVGSHDVGRLHPRHVVEEVVAAEQTGFKIRGCQIAVGRQVIRHVDHVHQGVGALERREGAVERADHVDLRLARLGAGQEHVDQRTLFGAGDIEAALLENGAELLLLLHGNELRREEDRNAGRRGGLLSRDGGGLSRRGFWRRRFGGGGRGLGRGRRGRRSRRGRCAAGGEQQRRHQQQAEQSGRFAHTILPCWL